MTAKPIYEVAVGFGITDVGTIFTIGHATLGKIGTGRLGASETANVGWQTLTGVQTIYITRGRQDELGKMEAGRCTLAIDNSSGAFSPENTASPYYPNVQPMKRLRVRAKPPYESMVKNDGAVAYWRLGEATGSTAYDSSGNGYNGTVINNPLNEVAGALADSTDTAYYFDGIEEYVNCGDITAFEFATTFTLEAWVKPSDTSTSGFGDPAIAKEGGGVGYQLTWDNANTRFGIMTNGGVMTWGTSGKSLGTYYHVVGTYDGTTARIYVNGVLENSAAVTYTPDLTTPLTIACFISGGTPGRFLDAVIDEVAVYGTALSLTQIQTHYNVGKGTHYCGLFYGQIERWRPDLQSSIPTVVVDATDLWLRLARQELANTELAQAATGTRLGTVLDLFQVPAGLRSLDTGKSTLPAVTPSATTALSHVEGIMEAEDGQYWIAGDGTHKFRDRHARLQDSVSTTSQATFGGATGHPCQFGYYDYGMDHIYNDVRVTRTGGTEQSSTDSDSQVRYGKRTLRKSSDHLLNDTEAAGLAGWYKGQFKAPIPRLKSIHLEGGGDDALWAQILTREINERITVVRDFPGSMGLNRAFVVEGVRHEITEGLNVHNTALLISAADVVNWLQIGHATRGKIGTGRIGY